MSRPPKKAIEQMSSALSLRSKDGRRGRWKIIKYPTGVEAFGYKEMTVQSLMCSNCSYEIDVSEGYFEYCPNCGSFMDLEENEDE